MKIHLEELIVRTFKGYVEINNIKYPYRIMKTRANIYVDWDSCPEFDIDDIEYQVLANYVDHIDGNK